MPTANVPKVECERHFPTLAVSDVVASADFYTKKLGFTPVFTWGEPPVLAGVDLGSTSIHLAKGTPRPDGCSVYFIVDNADDFYEFHLANGVTITQPPEDKPWEMRDYRIQDIDGYEIVFGHYAYNVGEPVEIERVDVPVRLEKRLAALLYDLAEHKGMSLDSCLEETLLHTLEPHGNVVACPHTKRTIAYIQELKKKHGIDYETHASYRFVEA